MPITPDHFPTQLPIYGSYAVVALAGDLTKLTPGEIVRADAEEPGVTIIALEDGRYVLGTECAFTPVQMAATILTPDQVEPTRQALEEKINGEIATISDEEWQPGRQREIATSIAEDILGDSWVFRVHLTHTKRPHVFVTKFKGEYAQPPAQPEG